MTREVREVDDELWAAIGDPTRRRVLDLLLTGGPGTASSLSRVSARPAGREVRYGVDPEQFAQALAQLAEVGRAWDGRLRRIKAIAEAIEETNNSR